jgi:hypothetical protein
VAVPQALPTLTVGSWTGRKPAVIYFTVDAGNIAGSLIWSVWDGTHAVGHGTRNELDCSPSCASGKSTPYPVTITLSGVVDGQFTVVTEETSDDQHSVETFHAPQIGNGACTTSDESTCAF